ncbi:OLC1v1005466C2 [Oldenlandia corymbosa var. corymbosa]|nr:OLC1v1005466C2 [Oldenlandia corymbosa var. corymbosa]
MRVDSVHSEAYKFLGRINRVGQEEEQEGTLEDAIDNSRRGEDQSKQEKERKVSPVSTLESSFEALNVKKFDVAFAVDPLYHQMSAQFDEGGAKGLLLNNLGVYGNCMVLFDSLELPGKFKSPATEPDRPEMIDIPFLRESIQEMVLNMPKKEEISPSLKDIVNLFDEDNRRPSEPYPSGDKSHAQFSGAEGNDFDFVSDTFDNCGTWGFDQDEQPEIIDESSYDRDPNLPGQHEGGEPSMSYEWDVDDRFEKYDGYLCISLRLASKQNAWAGPDHWKYRKAKEVPVDENAPPLKTKISRSRKTESEIDFSKALETNMPNVFAPPKNPKSLLLPPNRAPGTTRLPEDCHYQPDDLVKLFLLPNIMCLGRRRRKAPDASVPQTDDDRAIPLWDDENAFDGSFDSQGANDGDNEDFSNLVSQPRQVNKIEVQYDKTSKQVDVHALKETLWKHIREPDVAGNQDEVPEKVSFKEALAQFPYDCRAASSLQDISPHLCFICLLHLANEHGLQIQGSPNLDDLTIQF